MAIFTKLLAIRMVASKVRGFSFRAMIRLLEPASSVFRLARSLGESEKKAISLPDINADEMIRMTKKINENITPFVSKTKAA